MSKNFKGLGTDMIFLVFVVAIGCFLLYLTLEVVNIFNVAGIGGEVDILMTINDEGTNILSFLRTKKSDLRHIEILGALEAKNIPQGLENDLESTLESFGNYYLRVKNSGETVKKSGEPPHMGEINVKIPLPEGKTGVMELVTW